MHQFEQRLDFHAIISKLCRGPEHPCVYELQHCCGAWHGSTNLKQCE
jgi:hypothetical protein